MLVTKTNPDRNLLKTRLRRPLRILGRVPNHLALHLEDQTTIAVAKVVAVQLVDRLQVVEDHRVVRLVGVHSKVVPIIRRPTSLVHIIPSSRISCKSVAKPAIWMPFERTLMRLLVE